MFSEDSDLFKCLIGSRTRARIVVALHNHGEMHATMLAAVCKTNVRMVALAIRGGEPYFSTPLALASLGLVTERLRQGEPAFRLTREGEDAAALADLARQDRLR